MGLAVRKPQPSDPIMTLRGNATFELSATGVFEHWKWVEASAVFGIEAIATIGALVFIVPAEVSLELSDDLFHFYLEQIGAVSTLELNAVQNFTEQLIEEEEESAVDPGDSPGRIDTLEQELVVSTTNPAYYKEFSYVGEDLVGYSIYTNNTKSTELFNVVFTFNSGQLTNKSVTRISDGKVLSVTFGYTGDTLISQTRTIS